MSYLMLIDLVEFDLMEAQYPMYTHPSVYMNTDKAN